MEKTLEAIRICPAQNCKYVHWNEGSRGAFLWRIGHSGKCDGSINAAPEMQFHTQENQYISYAYHKQYLEKTVVAILAS